MIESLSKKMKIIVKKSRRQKYKLLNWKNLLPLIIWVNSPHPPMGQLSTPTILTSLERYCFSSESGKITSTAGK